MTLPAEPRTEQTAEHRADVCLVVPPFDSLKLAPFGISVLTAALRAKGISTRVLYGSLLLATRVGEGPYRQVCLSSTTQLLGERIFRDQAYDESERARLPPSSPLRDDLVPLYHAIRPATGPMLDTLARQVVALKPKIVGITSTFQQNMATFALARRIKARAPEICIVVGGSNISEPMGSGLAQVFPFVDHFFTGEADLDFPRFCTDYLAGRRDYPKMIASAPIEDMRVVSAPDFSDFFHALRHYQKRGRLPADAHRYLQLESSRGCWWGARNHCTFCGLNPRGMGFREKPAERVLDEIRTLMDDWNIREIQMSDNIMPLSYFKTVLPALAQWETRPDLFYETKANLKEEHVAALAAAGVMRLQPGIESLSSHVLKLMRKGVSAAQNIGLMRTARSHGVSLYWNLLFGFPGELREDYVPLLTLLPKLAHLLPPNGFYPVVIDRDSPYHNDHAAFGISEIAPMPSYVGLYPAEAPLHDIAYHFAGRYSTPLLADAELMARIRAIVGQWSLRWHKAAEVPRLEIRRTRGGRRIVADSRAGARPTITPLSEAEYEALRYFERARPEADDHGAHTPLVEPLLARDFLIAHEGLLLSIVVRQPDGRAALSRSARVEQLAGI